MNNPVAEILIDLMKELNSLAINITHEGESKRSLELVCKADGVIEAFQVVSKYAMKAIAEKSHDGCPHCEAAGGD